MGRTRSAGCLLRADGEWLAKLLIDLEEDEPGASPKVAVAVPNRESRSSKPRWYPTATVRTIGGWRLSFPLP